jgi:signal-transduction protein with cAMP-binding, CBS, and nucleotidyltransferase domain
MWEVRCFITVFDVILKQPSAFKSLPIFAHFKKTAMEKITDVLGRKFPQFNTVTTTTTVKDALFKMYCEHVDYLIVQEDDKYAGLLTEHEVVGKMLFSDKPLQQTLVKEFMTMDVPVVTAEDSLEYGMQLLEHYNARYLAVYDDFDFKGVISAQDLMRQTLKKRYATFSGMENQKHTWDY